MAQIVRCTLSLGGCGVTSKMIPQSNVPTHTVSAGGGGKCSFIKEGVRTNSMSLLISFTHCFLPFLTAVSYCILAYCMSSLDSSLNSLTDAMTNHFSLAALIFFLADGPLSAIYNTYNKR